MKRRIVFTLVLVMIFVSGCGPKMNTSPNLIVKQSESYAEEINTKNLEKETAEGALTDINGFKDIGTFKLTYYYNKADNELLRIENIETTNKVLVENFYFQNEKLTYASSKVDNESIKQLFFYKGKILKESTVADGYKDILLDKAKMYQKEFNKMMN